MSKSRLQAHVRKTRSRGEVHLRSPRQFSGGTRLGTENLGKAVPVLLPPLYIREKG